MNKHFKLPIAYFLTNGVEADFLANVVRESLVLIDMPGIKCVAVISDGLSANLKCAKLLGLNLSDINALKTWFTHPNGSDRVFMIFDVCHIIKLLRNLWKHFGVLYINEKVCMAIG